MGRCYAASCSKIYIKQFKLCKHGSYVRYWNVFRYTLHDAYGSTAVDMTGVALIATFVSPTSTVTTYTCPSPSTAHTAASGGDCSIVLPTSLFQASQQSRQFQTWLQLRAANGTTVHESSRTAITLTSKPDSQEPVARSGFMYAPYRHVYPGEEIRLAVFAHSGGQRAGGFQIRVPFDSSVLSYTGYELPSTWRVCFCPGCLFFSVAVIVTCITSSVGLHHLCTFIYVRMFVLARLDASTMSFCSIRTSRTEY